MIENYVETKLIDYPDLYSQTFKEYMLPDGIYSSPFSADRVIKIAGPSVELVGGSGTTYRCCNLLSKTRTIHWGTGTSAGIQSFLEANYNDVAFEKSYIQGYNYQPSSLGITWLDFGGVFRQRVNDTDTRIAFVRFNLNGSVVSDVSSYSLSGATISSSLRALNPLFYEEFTHSHFAILFQTFAGSKRNKITVCVNGFRKTNNPT